MNKVILIGRTTTEIRFNQTSNGISYARVTLAVERQGMQQETTDYLPLMAWRATAEFMNRNVRKGTLISIIGYLSSSNYQSKDGNLVRSYDVVVDNISILEPKSVVENRVPNPGVTQVNNFNSNSFRKDNNIQSSINIPNNTQNNTFNVQNQKAPYLGNTSELDSLKNNTEDDVPQYFDIDQLDDM